ncbi:MAG TPA: M20/M25/M40 family metallo-hydrolase, partial [Anaerolineales bacterium]|nr:M20/M25/M40 family metallo-hydrolase [Anaerolineales bacterium]
VRETVIQRFKEIVKNTAKAMGCKAEIELKRISPAVINNAEVTAQVQKAARKIYPKTKIDTKNYLTMGAEDMSFVLDKVPGCYFFVGSANELKALNYAHHHPKFDFDEEALPRATALMAGATMEILGIK